MACSSIFSDLTAFNNYFNTIIILVHNSVDNEREVHI